eukprot:6195901-Pleurochrysis_carterae.AAC.1
MPVHTVLIVLRATLAIATAVSWQWRFPRCPPPGPRHTDPTQSRRAMVATSRRASINDRRGGGTSTSHAGPFPLANWVRHALLTARIMFHLLLISVLKNEFSHRNSSQPPFLYRPIWNLFLTPESAAREALLVSQVHSAFVNHKCDQIWRSRNFASKLVYGDVELTFPSM